MNAWAFNTACNPFSAQLHALFGSDVGHFDVQDMAGVLHEAHELVDDGLMNADNFRDFVFANPVRFWAESNRTSSRARCRKRGRRPAGRPVGRARRDRAGCSAGQVGSAGRRWRPASLLCQSSEARKPCTACKHCGLINIDFVARSFHHRDPSLGNPGPHR